MLTVAGIASSFSAMPEEDNRRVDAAGPVMWQEWTWLKAVPSAVWFCCIAWAFSSEGPLPLLVAVIVAFVLASRRGWFSSVASRQETADAAWMFAVVVGPPLFVSGVVYGFQVLAASVSADETSSIATPLGPLATDSDGAPVLLAGCVAASAVAGWAGKKSTSISDVLIEQSRWENLMQILSLVSSLLAFLVAQGLLHRATGGLLESVAFAVIETAFLLLAVSIADLCAKPFDLHARLVTASHVALIVLEVCLLVLPNGEAVKVPRDMAYVWSCSAPDACPGWCLERGGQCVSTSRNFDTAADAGRQTSCRCDFRGVSSRATSFFVLQCGLSLFWLLASVALPLRHFRTADVRRRTGHPLSFLVTQNVLTFLPLLLLVSLIVDAARASPCLEDVNGVLRVGAPCMAFLLLAGEAKRIVVGMSSVGRPSTSVYSGGGLLVVGPVSVAGALYAVWHGDTQSTCSGLSAVHSCLLVVGALAALACPLLQRGSWERPQREEMEEDDQLSHLESEMASLSGATKISVIASSFMTARGSVNEP